MTSNTEKDLDDSIDRCGYCYDQFSVQNTPDRFTYSSKCTLCKKKYPIHKACAERLFKSANGVPQSRNIPITPSRYRYSKIILHCMDCKQLQCFYCRGPKEHKGSGVKIVCEGCELKWCFTLRQHNGGGRKSTCQYMDRGPAYCLLCQCKIATKQPLPVEIKKNAAAKNNSDENQSEVEDGNKSTSGKGGADDRKDKDAKKAGADGGEDETKEDDSTKTGGANGGEDGCAGGSNSNKKENTKKPGTEEKEKEKVDESNKGGNNGGEDGNGSGGGSENAKVNTDAVSDNAEGNDNQNVENTQSENENLLDIVRFSFLDEDDGFKPSFEDFIPEDKKESFLELMDTTFSISKTGKLSFSSHNESEEWIRSTFVSLNPEDNIFEMSVPPACEQYFDSFRGNGYNENSLFLQYNDILSVSNQNNIEAGIVNFMLKCFNTYVIMKEGNDHTPEIFFGQTTEKNDVSINNTQFQEVFSHIQKSISVPIDQVMNANEDVQDKLMEWYSIHPIKHLTEAMDFYDRRTAFMTNYCTIACVNGNCHFAMNFMLDGNNNDDEEDDQPICYQVNPCSEYDRDETINNNLQRKIINGWYSKYFGLYRKQCLGQKFSRNDFDCHDIQDHLICGDPFKKQSSNEVPSFIKIKIIEPSHKMDDGIDSILVCLDTCLDWLRGKKEKLPEKDYSYYSRFRITIVSFIHDFFNILNEEKMNKIGHHICMKKGDVSDKEDVMFFRKIIKLFDGGRFTIDDEKNSNANTMFEATYEKQDVIHNAYKEMYPTDVDQLDQDRDGYPYNPRKPGLINLHLTWHQVAKKHAHNKRIFDVSNSRMFLYHEKSKLGTMPDRRSETKFPEQIFDEIKELFMQQYYLENESEEEIATKIEIIDICMKEYDVYFTMVENQDTKQFELQGALVLEDLVYMKDKPDDPFEQHSMVHLMASTFDDELAIGLQKLLQTVLYALRLDREENIYLVTEPSIFKYKKYSSDSRSTRRIGVTTPADILSRAQFVRSRRVALKDLVWQDSETYVGTGKELYDSLDNEEFPTEPYRFLKISTYPKYFGRWNGAIYEAYNHLCGWQPATDIDKKRFFDRNSLEACKEKPGRQIRLNANGCREESDNTAGLHIDSDAPMKQEFIQSTYTRRFRTQNQCVWLCVAAILEHYDKEASQKMISKLNRDEIKNYEWMYLVSMNDKMNGPNQSIKSENILQQRLMQANIGYVLSKLSNVNLTSEDGYTTHLLKEDTKGIYVCCLQTSNTLMSHVISIDCDRSLIFDCMESNVLKLSRTNLDRCAGRDQMYIYKISLCYQIVTAPAKKKKPKQQQPQPQQQKKNKKRSSRRKRKLNETQMKK